MTARQDADGVSVPSLGQLHSTINGFMKLMDERDKRYEERNTANKEAVAAALTAAKEASEETKAGLKEYKMNANEWRGTVNDLISTRTGSEVGIKWLVATGLAAFSVLVALVAAGVSLFVFFAGRGIHVGP